VSTNGWWTRFAAAFAVALVTLGLPAWVLVVAGAPRANAGELADPPERLAETGLYADFAARRVAPDVLAFSPQYPLWTDGAAKRRWIRLPQGSAIDASDVDQWVFPAGTQLWKEFAFERTVETRYMQLGHDGRWSYATYVWSADGRDATLAPELGLRGACESGGGARHDIPGRLDCLACHAGTPNEVLGFSALQLSSDRDPQAPHATQPEPGSVDLAALVERGLVRNLPQEFIERAPRIVAATERERAALGYLHGNCASCHNARGPLANLELDLSVTLARTDELAPALRTTLEVPARFQGAAPLRIAAGAPERSLLLQRLSTRNPLLQMPPLGTHLVDSQAVALLTQWIELDLNPARLPPAADSNRNVSPYLSRKD
jgi:mono/diheme cytochrome c family protein